MNSRDLIVASVARITGLGTAVFFEKDPEPWWEWRRHEVLVVKPNGDRIATTARVEFARKVPPGEVMALLFPDLTPDQIPPGSKVSRIAPDA